MDSELNRIKRTIPIVESKLGKTACLAKWHHTTIYLQTGETHSCYHPPPHKIPLDEIIINPGALHNTEEKKLQRLEMLNGKKPQGCSYCWKIEDLGKDYISDRLIKTSSIYTDDRIKEIEDNEWNFNVNPEYIEISFSNECNFRCGYCHPKASSRYWNEIKKFGPYDSSTEHRQDIDWFKIYQREEDNPYVDAWNKWWPEVSKTLNILRITGGEPLLHKTTWNLLEDLKYNPKPNLQIEINSNLGMKTDLVIKLTDCINHLIDNKKIKNFKLYTSIDTWTRRAEYVRDGLDLKLWEKNLTHYLSNSALPVTFMITFNLFSITSFRKLLEKILEWRKKFNQTEQRIRFDTPHLKEPLIFDINILPKSFYLQFMRDNLKFMRNNIDNSNNEKFTELEFLKFKRITDYMAESTYPEDKLKETYKNFDNWFNTHDNRRNTDRYKVFPEMKNFFNLCKSYNQ